MLIFSRLLERMFENRGYTDSFLDTYEAFDPTERMLNSKEFCTRLYQLRHDPSRPLIVFRPDFDMDGVMSGVIGFAGLAELGFNVVIHAPNPQAGYGFGPDVIDDILDEYPNCKVIMTADNGISCFDGIAYARQKGIEMLITDHHKTVNGVLPEANLVVDPMQEADPYSMPYICGAAVIQQLLQNYADTYCDNFMKAQIRRLRVFAGIGTISDSMPLLHQNRQLVRDSVSICKMIFAPHNDYVVSSIIGNPVYCSAFYGLSAALRMFADEGKLSSKFDIDEQFFGFYLAPMFNSVKRMDGSILRAFGVFFGANKEADVSYLYDLNDQRKISVGDYTAEISAQSNPWAPYVYQSRANLGILGLLAMHMMDETAGPCLVVQKQDDGSYSGSGRSPVWYPFLTRANGHHVSAAGHEGAFGVHFDNLDEIKAFYAFIEKDTQDVLASVDLDGFKIKPDFVIDTAGGGDTGIDIMAFMEFLEEVKRFKPFGVGFEEPCIELRFFPSDAEWMKIGSAKQHLKLKLPYGFDVLIWHAADKIHLQQSTEQISLYGKLSINTFRGLDSVQFIGEFHD